MAEPSKNPHRVQDPSSLEAVSVDQLSSLPEPSPSWEATVHPTPNASRSPEDGLVEGFPTRARDSANVIDASQSGRLWQFASMFPLTANQEAVPVYDEPAGPPQRGEIFPMVLHPSGNADWAVPGFALDVWDSMKKLQGGIPDVKDFSPEDVMNVAGLAMAGSVGARVATNPKFDPNTLSTFAGADATMQSLPKLNSMRLKNILAVMDRHVQRGVPDKEVGELATNAAAEAGLGLGQIIRRQDGLWRFEIDDSQAKIVPAAVQMWEGSGKTWIKSSMGDLLDHPRLFRAYPELADIPVRFGKADVNSGGFTPDTNSIHLRSPTPNDMKMVLLHEIQHYIQQKEGFSPGSNPKMGWIQDYVKRNEAKWDKEATQSFDGWTAAGALPEKGAREALIADDVYRRTLGETEARQTASRMHMGVDERRLKSAAIPDEGLVVVHPDVRQTADWGGPIKDRWKKEYMIYDKMTGEIVADADTLKSASRMVDNRDNKYGAYRYSHMKRRDYEDWVKRRNSSSEE